MDATATTDVIRLTEARAADPATSGSKAATLAVLTSRGFPLPPGFVVTTVACDRILASVDPVAGDLAAAELPADVWAGIVAGLSWLGGDAVAVRSSGTAEDLAGASYAGQYEPVLGAKGPTPAVLPAGAAAQRLRDGQLVTVDGTAGVVRLGEGKDTTAVP